jgi:hypothetical protein
MRTFHLIKPLRFKKKAKPKKKPLSVAKPILITLIRDFLLLRACMSTGKFRLVNAFHIKIFLNIKNHNRVYHDKTSEIFFICNLRNAPSLNKAFYCPAQDLYCFTKYKYE